MTEVSGDQEADQSKIGPSSESDALPLPIQTFLWRQTSPFIRPKFGRQQISTAMEQREATKSLEKVLVQNIQFGLSPSLTEAIQSISRWRLIQAALPHVMHCTAALLYNRKISNFDKLGAAETKLLYTLHWIILDASEECSDAELEQGIRRPFDHYLLPITTLELMVYLFAPLTSYLKGSDFLSCFRLENGYKIWDPFFQARHPDIPSFVAQAKPKKTIFSGQHFEKKPATKFGDVFIGEGQEAEATQRPSDAGFPSATDHLSPPQSASCEPPKDSSLPTERRASRTTPESSSSATDTKIKFSTDYKPLKEPLMATYMDVAVIRCLFLSQWIEEGVDWALKFVINRLNDIHEETEKEAKNKDNKKDRSRSQSLPNMKFEFRKRTTTYLDSDSESVNMFYLGERNGSQEKDDGVADRRTSFGAISLPDPDESVSSRSFKITKKGSKKNSTTNGKKKSRKADWKVLRKAMMFASHERLPPRPGSSLGISQEVTDKTSTTSERPKSDSLTEGKETLFRGKSMPSLHIWLERRSSSSETKDTETKTLDEEESDSVSLVQTHYKKAKVHTMAPPPKPIITITEHSPVSSIQFFANHDTLEAGSPLGRKGMSRWSSDRNVSYFTDTNPEVAGSSHFITKNGHLSLLTILKAVHTVSLRDATTSLRTCDGCVKIIKLLLDLDILKKFNMGSDSTDEETRLKTRKNKQKEPDELTVHNLIVDTLMAVSRHLGCPNGCSEGLHGHRADGLRKDIRDLLMICYQQNENQFTIYFKNLVLRKPIQDVLDIFHSFTGFCVETSSLAFTLSKKHSIPPPPRSMQSLEQPTDQPRPTGFANNFGKGFGKVGPKGVEGVIIDMTFKLFVSRIVRMQKEVKIQDNLSLFCELRQFLNFTKESHGGTFRKVLLSALFDSAEKLFTDELVRKIRVEQQLQQQQESVDHHRHGRRGASVGTPDDLPLDIEDFPEQKSQKKSFFRKKESFPGPIKAVHSNQSISEDLVDLQPPLSPWMLSMSQPQSVQLSATPSAPVGLVLTHTQSSASLLRVARSSSPRLSIADDDAVRGVQRTAFSNQSTSSHKFPSIVSGLTWLKGHYHKDQENYPLFPSKQEGYETNGHPLLLDKVADKLNRRASVQTTASRKGKTTFIMGAKKRVEDQFSKIVFGKNKHKPGSIEDHLELSRRPSLEHYFHPHMRGDGGDIIPLRETKLVSLPLVKSGMLRFSFLMEACNPGSLPDPAVLAAALDIKAPIVARAAFYLEVAHFVHSCNRGQWPTWMKMSLPIMRPSGPGKSATSMMARRGSVAHNLHRTAGRMFYQWAEAIGARLEDMDLKAQKLPVANLDDTRKRYLRTEDEDEDFLNEAVVNPNGNDCPFALKLAATQVLLEISAFLRESHQYLPTRTSRASISKPMNLGDRTSLEPRTITANRRWSMALSSLGFSQNSAHSLVSLADTGHGSHPPPTGHPSGAGERRISFVLHEADGEVNSLHSSAGSEAERRHQEKRLSQSNVMSGRPNLLRRSTAAGGSFRRRSLKLKKQGQDRKNRHRSSTVDEYDEGSLGPTSIMRRADSMKSRGRRVSGISERSDVSGGISGEESPGVLSDDGQLADFPVDTLNADDADIVKNFPWIRVVLNLLNGLDFDCRHQSFCQSNCFRRQIRACQRLVRAVKKVYEPTTHKMDDKDSQNDATSLRMEDREELLKKEKKFKKIITGTGPSSPVRRKVSVGPDRPGGSAGGFGDHASIHSSMTQINAIDVEAGYGSDGHHRRRYFTPGYLKPKKEDLPHLKYINNQVKDLFHCPVSLLLKSTLVLTQSHFIEQLVLSWEMLLEEDHHLSSTAAAAFIVASVKCSEIASELLHKELENEDPNHRIDALLKFYTVWRARHQCWPRMEDGAHNSFKVPPPGIEFTLPSPKIALDTMPVADPPWMPTIKAKVEEVTISQEQSMQKSFVTATKTRRKQQIEMVRKAIREEQEKLREEREQFRVSAVSVNMQASYEPALFHTQETEHEDTDDEPNDRPVTHVQVAQSMFPSCLTSASVVIINLLDDSQVSPVGSAVYEVAYKVIWHCLVEDTALFLRHFFERLTREKQKETFQILRRLIRFMPRLPAQAAYTLYNYLIGFVMFNVRSPTEGSQELIGATLSVLWLVVPSVHGLFLKDLKQILRKEQCDANLLITANVPSAKKIIVYGPEVGGIPSQFPIQEDTQFSQILIDSLDFFGIDDSLLNEYYLVDAKTNEIHNLNAFVRDFYFFKRSQYPQLSLIRLNPQEAFEKLQKQAFTLQFLELGKALMSLSIVKSNYLAIQRVLFLHEELMKLPSFPRKALEAHFSLYRSDLGKAMLGMDTLHKLVWIRLVGRMFEVTSSFFAQSSDIHLFVNVINGALILHCEDAAVLRLCMATFLNVAHQFKNIFAINGYLMIIPTILQIYSNHQSNGLLCRTIEFVCKQFYIMHRKPFLLQMFGSAAPILDVDTSVPVGDATKIQPFAFFKLLQSLHQYISDPLDILELVDVEKPLKALDFCYQMDSETVSILDLISLCVTVVSYSADCMRSHQMLTILECTIPLYMRHIQGMTMRKETPGGPRAELQTIHNISVCLRTLINNCEPLTRNYSGPQRVLDVRASTMKPKGGSAYKQNQPNSPPIEIDEDSHSRYWGDNYQPTVTSRKNEDDDDYEDYRKIFRRPRDTLLNLVSEFLTRSTQRLADLSKKLPDLHQKGSSFELLDVKSHLRLAEVAHSLLKVAPYDPQTMGCRGLVRYMNEVLPTSEWRQEAMRPALIVILRRLDKMFTKISKKSNMKRMVDWEASKRLLKGVYVTFIRHPYIVHLPHLKSLINVCQTIVLGDGNAPIPSITGATGAAAGTDPSYSQLPSWAAVLSHAPPAGFSSVAVRLIAMQMLQMGDSQTLEVICGTNLSPEKTEMYLMNLIYPMAIRISGGLKEVPKLRLCDVQFTLNLILNSLNPPARSSKGQGGANQPAGSDSNSFTAASLQTSLHSIGFLGLKILMVCFDRLLANEWHRIARCIRDMLSKNIGGITIWNFLDFVVTYRTPLFVLLLPVIRCKILLRVCSTDQEYYYQQQIKQKIFGKRVPSCRCRGQLLMYLLAEMKQLREDLTSKKAGISSDRKSQETSLGHRLSFAISAAFQGSTKVATTTSISSPQGSTPADPNSPLEKTSGHGGHLTRVFSFRDRPSLPVRGMSVKIGDRKVVDRFLRRTSYPYNVEEATSTTEGHPNDGAPPTSATAQSSSEPKLFRRSTLLIKLRASGKRGTIPAAVSPVKVLGQDKISPEESSVAETIDEGAEDGRKDDLEGLSPGDSDSKGHRLQRQKVGHGSAKKAFRFRKGGSGKRSGLGSRTSSSGKDDSQTDLSDRQVGGMLGDDKSDIMSPKSPKSPKTPPGPGSDRSESIRISFSPKD